MGSRQERDRQKLIQDRCQNLLTQMLRDDDNKYCVDCDAKGPRWASWNLGIFLCIRCAGIHRNLGVHISKVKSVNLDTWTPEQIVSLQSMGNSRGRAVYEANLPDGFRRPQTDTSLEAFIRAKYETRKYLAKEWVQPPLPKVNWDKELDEEEKAKKKKRESKTGTATIPPLTNKKLDSIVPQPLPKPATSPKSSHRVKGGGGGSPSTTPPLSSGLSSSQGRNPGSQSSQTHHQPSTDLLGLDTPVKESRPGSTRLGETDDEAFSDFLTPPAPPPGGGGGQGGGRSEEEENFFSQPSAVMGGGGGGRLTTDSILALYSQGVGNQGMGGGLLGGYNHLNQMGGGLQPIIHGLNKVQLSNGNGTSTPPGPLHSQQQVYQANAFSSPQVGGLGSNPFYSNSLCQQPVPPGLNHSHGMSGIHQSPQNMMPYMSGGSSLGSVQQQQQPSQTQQQLTFHDQQQQKGAALSNNLWN